MPLPPLYFLHLDRCGGTSVINWLHRVATNSGQFHLRTDTPATCLPGFDIISGHFPLSSIIHLPQRLLITTLRDPVDRELSVLNKCAVTEPHSIESRLRLRIATRSIDEYIHTFIHDGLYASRYAIGPRTVASACSALSAFDLVGVTERLPAFFTQLATLLHCTSPPTHDNTSPPHFTFTTAQRALITSRLPDNHTIYNHALTLAP